MASHAPAPNDPPSFRNIRQNSTAHSDTAPSIDRSMEPMTMMKVTPSATIIGGVEASAIRARLRCDRKAGLIAANSTTNPSSTRAGAHRMIFSRVSFIFNAVLLNTAGPHAPKDGGEGRRAVNPSDFQKSAILDLAVARPPEVGPVIFRRGVQILRLE